ncbi:MAG: hypothetical protein R3261_07575, partial [Alphaproteobacteria bacterium]|nr:hypothetical protein [Alphaproteobacteria bacterium]
MADQQKIEKPNIPFRTRFHAWWIGVNPEDLLEDGAQDYHDHPEAIHIDNPDAGGGSNEPEEPQEYWNPDRIDFLTRLWGGEDQNEVVSPG